MLRLLDIIRYPVKSTAGHAVAEAVVEARGLAGDRRWMVVDAGGVFLSQRSTPRLALLRATPTPTGLRLSGPGRADLVVPRPEAGAPRRAVVVWDDTVAAAEAPAAADWLAAYLGSPAALVYLPDDVVRPVDPAYGDAGDHVSFADGYPVLLTTTASLDDLNARLPAPLPMNRFRPNLVVEGGEAFEEDRWARVRIGDVAFRVVKPCARCAVTTVDQATGVPGKEPLKTLATFRRTEGKVMFGQNLIPEAGGTVHRGDRVEVLTWRQPLF